MVHAMPEECEDASRRSGCAIPQCSLLFPTFLGDGPFAGAPEVSRVVRRHTPHVAARDPSRLTAVGASHKSAGDGRLICAVAPGESVAGAVLRMGIPGADTPANPAYRLVHNTLQKRSTIYFLSCCRQWTDPTRRHFV